MHWRILFVAAGLALASSSAPGATPAFDTSCFDAVARTRSFTLGTPAHAVPSPDGKTVYYLRSGPADTVQGLFALRTATQQAKEILSPQALLRGHQEELSAEEKARRERARVSAHGFTAFELSSNGRSILLPLDGRLYIVSASDGKFKLLQGKGWLAPKFSPDGSMVAALRDHDLYVVDIASGKITRLTFGGSELRLHGEAEFVAQEEMDRRDGFWWSPDSRALAYEIADQSGVEPHYIADPLHPEQAPVEFRYPRAGTANAVVSLGVVSVAGGPSVMVRWNKNSYPYLGRVAWMKNGPLSLVVQNRLQTEEKYLAADAHTGATRLLWTERDKDWVTLPPDQPKQLPYWLADGSGFLWMTERNGQTQLERHAPDGRLLSAITPRQFRFDALLDVDAASHTAIVSGGMDRLSDEIFEVSLNGDSLFEPIADARGLHTGEFGDQHAVFAHGFSLLDGSHGVELLARDGRRIASIPSVAAAPHFMPQPHYYTVGRLGFDALLLEPRNFDPTKHYPVVLSVYGGPAAKMVWASPRFYFADQCLADAGYVVAVSDNRGTPGRNAAWIRAIKGDAIDIPLADQIEALQALARIAPQMDLARVGVFGWSFGGYFSAMATIRRPDIFAAGIAGAPVVDWQDYDTHYTERYMGLPSANPEGYRKASVLSYADQLQRPLLLVHGVTDDNVYFENTMQLALAFLKDGKPYDLLLLPGTHMLADPILRARETARELSFFATHLGSPR